MASSSEWGIIQELQEERNTVSYTPGRGRVVWQETGVWDMGKGLLRQNLAMGMEGSRQVQEKPR